MLHDICVVRTARMLRNLEKWIDKAVEHAEAKGFDPETFVEFRLAPDMFTFARQVQAACDAAKFAASRVAGQEAPKHEDNETTLAELRARIRSTVEHIEGIDESAINGGADREVRLSFMPGRGMRGADYLVDFAQPNFFFHLTTA